MLEKAYQHSVNGVDVLMGHVETRGRAETEEKLGVLGNIPAVRSDLAALPLPDQDV